MADALRNFDKRARAVQNKHRQLAQGYVTKMDRDGVLRHKPMRRFRLFRLSFLVYPLLILLGFKTLFLTELGAEAYDARIERLQAGGTIEQIGAKVMQIDPVTRLLAGFFRQTPVLSDQTTPQETAAVAETASAGAAASE